MDCEEVGKRIGKAGLSSACPDGDDQGNESTGVLSSRQGQGPRSPGGPSTLGDERGLATLRPRLGERAWHSACTGHIGQRDVQQEHPTSTEDQGMGNSVGSARRGL